VYDKKSCANCCERYLKDYGYSDWTVEGTAIRCRLGKNPGYPSEDPSTYQMFQEPHTFAENCESYIEGHEDIPRFSVEDDVPDEFGG
jgi:hypothetical protein